MRDSLRFGSINGITIGVHWTIAIVAALFTLALSGGVLPAFAPGYTSGAYMVMALVTAVLFFASIVAHELGHSLVAQRNGIGVSGITLFALGGVAKLESDPKDAGSAARIALAGPAVSVAIGVGGLVAGVLAGALGLPTLVAAGLAWLGIINLGMAVFNMIPALPLDGGRTLQAYLWHRSGDRDVATISAAKLGRFLGWAMIAFGLWQFLNGGAGLWFALIGWFVTAGARAEAMRARFEIQRRTWAPPAWPPFGFRAGDGRQAATGGWPGGPVGFPPYQQAPPPTPADRYDVVDVTGRPVERTESRT
ncbi:MAG: site-2 protease family protein [Actinomycetota bacterium]